MKWWMAVTLAAAGVFAGVPTVRAQATDPATRREHGLHGDTDAYIRMLDNPARDGYQKPAEVVAALALKPGAVVADIGSGSGYFTFRFAKAVGDTGRVFAVDVEPKMIEHVKERATPFRVARSFTCSIILGSTSTANTRPVSPTAFANRKVK